MSRVRPRHMVLWFLGGWLLAGCGGSSSSNPSLSTVVTTLPSTTPTPSPTPTGNSDVELILSNLPVTATSITVSVVNPQNTGQNLIPPVTLPVTQNPATLLLQNMPTGTVDVSVQALNSSGQAVASAAQALTVPQQDLATANGNPFTIFLSSGPVGHLYAASTGPSVLDRLDGINAADGIILLASINLPFTNVTSAQNDVSTDSVVATDQGTGAISLFTHASTTFTPVGSPVAVAAASQISDSVIDPTGGFSYTVNFANGTLVRLSNALTNPQADITLTDGSDLTASMAAPDYMSYDASHDVLYVVNQATGSLLVYPGLRSQTASTTIAPSAVMTSFGGGSPLDVAVDTTHNVAYVVTSTNAVASFGSASGLASGASPNSTFTFVGPDFQPDFVASDGANDILYVSDGISFDAVNNASTATGVVAPNRVFDNGTQEILNGAPVPNVQLKFGVDSSR